LSTGRGARAIRALVASCALVAACTGGSGGPEAVDLPGCDGTPATQTIEAWMPVASAEDEAAVRELEAAFNAAEGEASSEVSVRIVTLPADRYAATIAELPRPGERLPDVVELDAAQTYRLASAGMIQPIDNCVPQPLADDLIPSVADVGRFDGERWAVERLERLGAIYGLRPALERAGVRLPVDGAEAWTAEEFGEILEDLADERGVERPLAFPDLDRVDADVARLFAPILWSAGGDVIENDDPASAADALEQAEVIDSLSQLQGWFDAGLAGVGALDDEKGAVLAWDDSGAFPAYSERFGDDLVLLPLPDFGKGSFMAQGGHQWAVGAGGDADVAWRFIDFTLRPDNLLRFSELRGDLPSRQSVLADDEHFGEGTPRRYFVVELEAGRARAMPAVARLDLVEAAFAGAMRRILGEGADVGASLQEAADEVADQAAETSVPTSR